MHRREFFRFLAGSPLLAGVPARAWQEALGDPKAALNVMDFEGAARKALPPAHFGYLTTGVDDDLTMRANREGFQRVQLRPRRLIDVTQSDQGVTLFGKRWDTPVVLCPCGSLRAFHPEGELTVARAARARKTLQMLSTVTTYGVEEVIEARGEPVWFQLYASTRWDVTQKLVKRAEAAGCPVLAVTVDQPIGRNTETLERMKRADGRVCGSCHDSTLGGFYRRRPMFKGIEAEGLRLQQPALTWDSVRKLRDLTTMKIVLKGIVTREDAELSVENGVDGIVVSNHGGREEESGRGTIECLPEVVQGVRGRIPVLIDGGIRRGTDVFKALALGASAVGVGRPYLWGLGAFGQPGVERVLEILRGELDIVMRQCGTRSVAEITPAHVLIRH